MNHLNKSYFAYHMPYLRYEDGHWCLCYKLYPEPKVPSPPEPVIESVPPAPTPPEPVIEPVIEPVVEPVVQSVSEPVV